jgi:hypothetical protein
MISSEICKKWKEYVKFFLEGKRVGPPHRKFLKINMNPTSHPWALEPGWPGCTSTALTK